jgi:hypothetical protein
LNFRFPLITSLNRASQANPLSLGTFLMLPYWYIVRFVLIPRRLADHE